MATTEALFVAAFAAVHSLATGVAGTQEAQPAPVALERRLDCVYLAPGTWFGELEAAEARGAIPSLQGRVPPVVAPHTVRAGGSGCLTNEQIFLFEDSNQLLLMDFGIGEMIDLMVDAANALLAEHGDNYDFVGYWINFIPHHTVGAAFNLAIENDVLGIGDPSGQGVPIFNYRPMMGLGGDEIEGFVMMWNVNSPSWQPGSGPNAQFTRLALAHEIEHRYALFLPPLLDGRKMQGGPCGTKWHWNWNVDGQGSCMEISEWEGANPAQRTQSFLSFNKDIPGGTFSYTDLYLMGFVSGAEMDAGNSELRYMDGSNCSPTHNGPVSHFSSADVIASAGPRIPSSATAQKNFRMAWIMMHLPGDPPDAAELSKATSILEQQRIDWDYSTLGRSRIDHSLFDDCNCNGIPDRRDINGGGSADVNGNGIPDECECDVLAYCTAKTNSCGGVPQIAWTGLPSASATAGFEVRGSAANFASLGLLIYTDRGRASLPFQGGLLCLDPTDVRRATPISSGGGSQGQCDSTLTFDLNAFASGQAGGNPAPFLAVPGTVVNTQWWGRDTAAHGSYLSDALEYSICP